MVLNIYISAALVTKLASLAGMNTKRHNFTIVLLAGILVAMTAGCLPIDQSALQEDEVENTSGFYVSLSLAADKTKVILAISAPLETNDLVLCESANRIEFCGLLSSLVLRKLNIKGESKIPDTEVKVSEKLNSSKSIYYTEAFPIRSTGSHFALYDSLGNKRLFVVSSGSDDEKKLADDTSLSRDLLVPGDITGLRKGEIEVVRRMNEYRLSKGKVVCELTARLNQTAKANSLIQERKRYSGHFTRPGPAEIAFYGVRTPVAAMAGWKNSPGHNGLMLTNYRYCGVSMGTNGDSWTINFSN